MSRKQFTSARLKKKRRNKIVWRFVFIVLSFSIILFSLSFISKADVLTISDIKVEGAQVIDREAVKNTVNEILKGNFMHLFSRANIFMFPKSEIKAKLTSEFPRVKGIAVTREGLSSIAILIEERQPVAVWCEGEASTASRASVAFKKCYFLDEDGLIFDKAPDFSGHAYFEFHGLVKGDPLRQQYLTAEKFKEIGRFISGVEKLDMKPVSLIASDDGDFELIFDTGSRVMWNEKQDFQRLLENLQAVLDGAGLKSAKSIDYIDLRFGNKVFYKVK